MRRDILPVASGLILLLCGAWEIGAQAQATAKQEIKTGQVILRFAPENHGFRWDRQKGEMQFKLQGVEGESPEQHLSFQCQSATGLLKRSGGADSKDYVVDSAALKGDVVLTSDEKGSDGSTSTTTVTAPLVKVKEGADSLVFTIPTSPNLTEKGEGQDSRTVTLVGDSGEVQLAPAKSKTNHRFREANFDGHVKVTFESASKSEKGTSGKATVTCEHLKATWSGSDYVFHLTGGVHFEGEGKSDDPLSGSLSVDPLTIHVSEKFELTQFEGGDLGEPAGSHR